MIWISYMISSFALYIWTTMSVVCDSNSPKVGYLLILIVLNTGITILWFLDKERQIRKGVFIMAFLTNFGLSVSYRMKEFVSIGFFGLEVSRYTIDLLLMIGVFVAVYETVRHLEFQDNNIFKFSVILLLPVTIIGARLTGNKIYGSYLYFCGIMVFGIVLALFPFAASSFMSMKENHYIFSVKRISWDMMGFLLYSFLLYAGCMLLNEFGLLLILGLTSSVLFWIRCKDMLTKTVYTCACGGGAFLASVRISHINDRVRIWLNPASAFGDQILGEKAESTLYLFRHIYQMGWWGNGIGNLPKSIYRTLDSDHVLITLMNDYSILLAILILFLSVILVRWMLMVPAGLDSYFRYLNLSCALIMAFILLINVASNLGSFITAGIGFPFISDGGSVNLMLTSLVAVHCGLIAKGSDNYD